MRDVVVVGGGPAGWMAAIEAARCGLSVAVVERQGGVVDKACGEGLMPGAVRALGALGVALPAGRPFLGISYLAGGHEAVGGFGGAPGLGLRRTALHGALLSRADALGVERVERSAGEVVQHADHVEVAGVRARWAVGADGLRSGVRAALGLDDAAFAARWPRRYGLRRHFSVKPWTSHVEVWWADDAEAYVTPVADDLVGVAFLFDDRARGPGRPWERLLARFPGLRERLGPAEPATSARGAGPFAVRATRVVSGRVLLIGDAAGYLDPLTGEGVHLAAIGARSAVEAIRTGRPEVHEAAVRRAFAAYVRATGALLRATRPAAGRRALVALLARAPWAFDAALGWLAR